MATITVTTALDLVDAGDGRLSLREAVAQANATAAADTILFAKALEGKTLTLTGGELVLRQDVTIDGDQDNNGSVVTLSGGDTQRIFRSSGNGTDVELRDLALVDGRVGDASGGGIFVGAATSVTLSNSSVVSCVTYGGGGGIFAEDGSLLTIVDSTLGDNSAFYGGGGAILGQRLAEIIVRHSTLSGNGAGYYGTGGAIFASLLTVEDSILKDNGAFHYGDGGAISIFDGSATILRSSLNSNSATFGGALSIFNAYVSVQDSTIANNTVSGGYYGAFGGGIASFGQSTLLIANSTLSGNLVEGNSAYAGEEVDPISGGGVYARDSTDLTIVNSILSGNVVRDSAGGPAFGPDLFGGITFSNGHNLFGSDVAGNVSGDRESVAASAIFAAIDPDTGGGLLSASGIVPLRNAITNPALSGADPLAASDTGQLGGTGRPLPVGSLPDIGSIEISQTLSKTASANNDVLTGTAKANTIDGLAGADLIKGLAGNDTLKGGDGGDVLDGGAGNDKLYGDAGIDLVFYGGSTKVKVDLSLATDKATRGGETDTLYNVEGAIGSSAADTFKGNEYNNYFQGGLGKDTATGGAGRDTYDVNAVAESKAGASRDVITDFTHLADRIDLMGIDADTTVAGNQAFHWVGGSALTGPGEVGFFTTGGNTIIRASNDADAASELEIQLTGIKTLSAADFYL